MGLASIDQMFRELGVTNGLVIDLPRFCRSRDIGPKVLPLTLGVYVPLQANAIAMKQRKTRAYNLLRMRSAVRFCG